jgi:uncharacterized cupin superfamily protein
LARANTNIFSPDFEPPDVVDGFRDRCARVAREAGASRLGASVYELPPGQSVCPYHYHLREEELLVALVGRPWLRTPEGWRELEEGEVVAFPVGPSGAHQVLNRGDAPVRVLIASENREPEICVYPDSDKVGVFDSSFGRQMNLPMSATVDYFEGEGPAEVVGS